MQKGVWEVSLAGWSMFILGVVLVTVYIIFFSLPEKTTLPIVEWEYEAETPQKEVADTIIASVQENKNNNPLPSEYDQQKVSDLEAVDNAVVPPPTQSIRTQSIPASSQNQPRTPTYIVAAEQLFNPSVQSPSATVTTPPVAPQQILYLAWTHHRVWVMKSAKFVGFERSIQYILKNNDNTHFAYLWKELPDIADSLTALWAKSVAITDKNDIHIHWLFGDKIIFLLVPQYVGKKQLFFVYFAEARDRWFIQVDTDIFETTKPLLRELFAKRYNR